MSDYSIRELEVWCDQIESLARKEGLDFFEQEFELVGYEDMLACEAYAGMPSHYPHWSFGKAYERLKTMNRYNLSGLPYEMVINSNPCIAYLMRDNTLLLQILTIAHVYAHNDFFKNNRFFKQGTKPEYTIAMFKNHAARIREHAADSFTSAGRVEEILNAAHAVRFLPDLLKFMVENSGLKEWEKDILQMAEEEAVYFIPQMETKIMNEGWASYWHYTLLQKLKLPQKLQFEFFKRHNQVVRPYEYGLNPYWLGYELFRRIERKFGRDKLFEVRGMERDESFIRRYLDQDLCSELNLLEYSRSGNDYIVSEIADEDGWKKIRNTMAASSGMGAFPVIRVRDWNRKDQSLSLEHVWDGRELETTNAYETLKHIVDLWDGKVILDTVADGRNKQIVCDNYKRISVSTI